ncbi:MAG: RNase adapter RapZ [Oligoflexales bacterium]|nr:RNase adapter RapZ [Oligoflexales bacterium]
MNATHQDKPLIIFVTGISGAGLKTGINALEDSGVYCIDNLPLEMIQPTLELIEKETIVLEGGVAFGIHVRTAEDIPAFLQLHSQLSAKYRLDILFLTAEDSVLELRYSANRRRHYFLQEGRRLQEAFNFEKSLKASLEEKADIVIDTSQLSPHQLTRMIEHRYKDDVVQRNLYVMLTSFGFKYGQCRPADSLFDVRFLKNPYFVPDLKDKTGLTQEVQDYVLMDENAEHLLQKLIDWHRWILPQYLNEGKHYFRVGIGCTGGRHRSVSIVEELYRALNTEPMEHIVVSKNHRDIKIQG